MSIKALILAGSVVLSMATSAQAASATLFDASPQIDSYAQLVFRTYETTYNDALKLQKAVNVFLDAPSEKTLEAAKQAWLVSRNSYGLTEAFRFYEGPIDFVDDKTGKEGPEGRLNAWPLNEAYIDYVVGDPNAGIVNNTKLSITKESLSNKNQEEDEADVSTGYHAIEFLLWGQDLNKDGPGARPVSDYIPGKGNNDRRREYLKAATDLLVDDLKFLVTSWQPGQKNYATTFKAMDKNEALGKILTSLATLSGFELASERMATALDSGDQEDEHSCFSDNTHNDFIYNAMGIKNVYLGTYGKFKGKALHELVQQQAPEVDKKILAQLDRTEKLIASIPHLIDRDVLATAQGSQGRKVMEEAVTSLQKQADLFKEAGKALGINVEIQQD